MKRTVQKENIPSQEHLTTCNPESKAALRGFGPKSILTNLVVANPMQPHDPGLASPMYFLSPAETLLESLRLNADDISFHDLIEAYNAFSDRIKSQIHSISNVTEPQPALVSLQKQSRQLVRALLRDLKRAQDYPTANARASFVDNSFQTSAELIDEEVRVARDLASLNLHVLRFISNIFSVPPLHSIFSIDDLRAILSELLVLGSTESIPSPASQRTWAFVIWILSVQNLPSAVLSPVKREIAAVMKRALEGQMGTDQAKLNGLKASSHLLKQCPSLFIPPLLDVFPCVLQSLIADSSSLRLQAVVALGRFALAKLDTLSNSCHASISAILTTFINAQTSKLKSLQHELRLRNLVNAAISADTRSSPADSPFWAVQLLASFVILLDDTLFPNPRALKLTLQSLEQIAGHRQKLVSALHPHIWRCLIWVSSRLPAPVPGDDESHDDPVFLTLKQDLRGGIGLALVFSLLGSTLNEGCHTTALVSKALMVVRDMLFSSGQLLQVDGVALLTRLLYNPAKGAVSVASQDLLIRQLFDGSLLLSKQETIMSTARSFQPLDISHLRPLSDAEIIRHWDNLADLWAQAMRISLRDDFDQLTLPPPYLSVAEYKQHLLRGWQSLLLPPSDLTQGFGHLTTPAPFADKVAALICSFIVPINTAEAQAQQLCLVSQMWHTVTNVFQPTWLFSPAETILGAVLKQNYCLSEQRVRDSWAEFCSELISLGISPATRGIMALAEAQMPSEVQRQLWIAAANSPHKPNGSASWKDLAYFLSVPYRARIMLDGDVETWKELLHATIENAKVSGTTPAAVIEHCCVLVGETHKFSDSPEELAMLLSHVDLAEESALPEAVMSVIQNALSELYAERAMAPATLRIIRQVRDIIISAPSALALPLLLALQDSFCQWLEDEHVLLDDNVRKEVAQCLYTTPLSTIGDVEPSGEILVSLSRFLVTLADSYAFEQFWRMTYHGRNEFVYLYTDKLKSILRILDGVWGGTLAADLSIDTDTEADSHAGSSCAEQSQADYDADYSRYPYDTTGAEMTEARSMDVDGEDDDSTSTVRRRSKPAVVITAALEQLQEYSSRADESSISSGSSRSSATVQGQTPFVSATQRQSASTKRRAELQAPLVRKRRRTAPEEIVVRTSADATAGPSRLPSAPVSEQSILLTSSHRNSSRKQKQKRKLILDYVEVPPFAEVKKRRPELSLPTPSPSFRPRPSPTHHPPPKEEEEEDYDSWEAGLSMAELKHVQHTFGRDTAQLSPEYQEAVSTSRDLGDSRRQLETSSDPSPDDAGRRSLTAPIPPREHYPLPLRRNKTSARLDALERAYAAITEGDSQPPIQDLVQATRWVHRIGAALNEQMSRNLDKA